MIFTTLLDELTPQNDGRYAITVPEAWTQGRTLYGGLGAALCAAATRRAFPDLPALRSAVVAFAGPAGGALSIVPTLLRRGKSASFVRADLAGEGGLGTTATFCFGAARESALPSYAALPMPDAPPPAKSVALPDGPFRPNFTRQFDMLIAGGALPFSASQKPQLLLWVRHKDKAAGNSDLALLAIGDVLPPAAITMFRQPAPISSMTWQFDLLVEAPEIPDGWLLAQTITESVGHGYSTQNMTLWSSTGAAVATGRQTVAVFV